MTILFAIILFSLGTSFGFVIGAFMTSGRRADEDLEATPRWRTVMTSRGRRNKPHLVLISPNEVTLVKTV